MQKKSAWTKVSNKKHTANNRGHCKAEIDHSQMIHATENQDLRRRIIAQSMGARSLLKTSK